LARDFADADRATLQVAAERVRRAAAVRLVRALDRHADQARLLRAEAARDRRWRSLPDLVRDAPDVIAAAHPCWAMSPLVVGQTLPSGAQFDVVVLDESSLCSVGESVGALSRGRQGVVVGDPQQLSPWATLMGDGSPDDAGPGEAVDSVLDLLLPLLPAVALRTQHGVLNEQVTAFAATQAYGGSLTTLPSASAEQMVSLDVVDGTAMLVPGQDAVESTDAAVDRVVALVIDHARTRPRESLGVVALTAAHAGRIRAALRLELSHHPAAQAFVTADRPENFFVKVVDHAQGDTRDAIILAVGYGRTPHGRVLHRFGALSRPGGERLLTTATTRARRRVIAVSAFGAADLDPERLSTPGARRLRELLEHLADGPARFGPATGDRRQVDPLLADLAARLRSDGLEVREGPGPGAEASAVVVGDEGGARRVPVDADGPACPGADARERDRVRPAELARRGWVHERVWSTDLFRDPAREVARVRGSVRAALPVAPPGARRAGSAGQPAGEPTGERPRVRWDTDRAQPAHEPASGSSPQSSPRSADVGGQGSPWTAVVARRRGERPRVPTGRLVEDYREDELDQVVAWICSDTLLRTREQLAALVRQQLGLVRRGSRVDAAVDAAITRVESRGDIRTAGAATGPEPSGAGRRPGAERVDPHDPHERWLLDQRPPHWD
jgi:hypothetical protein